MVNEGLLLLAALAWLGLLFGSAVWGERHPAALRRGWGVVFALSLAVYCTSWTFFGTVQQALDSGWMLPPTFLGTIALYLLAFPLVLRLFRLARELNTTSIADLVATRLGRSSALAAVVTAIAVLGMIPYLALQLRAVAMSHGLLTGGEPAAAGQDSALYVAIAMAAFVMLFGTRRASLREHNRGLVLAMAVESLLKLAAMLALGAWLFLRDPAVPAAPLPEVPGGTAGFPALILLGALAMAALPHQFHVGFVEGREESHLRLARWLFPLYLVLIALPVLPLARAGEAAFGALDVPADLYVLALPMAEGATGMALLAFLGGLSAATGMLVLATLTLSVMIGNHWVTPLRARGDWPAGEGDLRGAVLMQRRVAIAAVLLLAWGYSRMVGEHDALAEIGALSFSALATLAPAVGFALWRPQTPAWAVIAGLLAGFAVWTWVLLVPALAEALGLGPALHSGLAGLGVLSPAALFGLDGWSPLSRGVVASLLVGGLLPLLLAMWWPGRTETAPGALDVAAVRRLAARFLTPERLADALAGAPADGWLDAAGAAGAARVERELAAVVGASSAKLLLDALRHPEGPPAEQVVALVDEATQGLRAQQQLLGVALEHMSQGLSVVDRELRLVVWNRRYRELFDYPPELLQVGTPVARLVEHNLRRGLAGEVEIAAALESRLAHMRAGTPYLSERRIGGRTIEIRGEPMPDGGFVATFTDVTLFRASEDALRRDAETLEARVGERTRELAEAKAEAERANQAKTRFLAAVGHDLAQPLHAARLLSHGLAEQAGGQPALATAVGQVDAALGAAEELLAGLLDISRLEAGGLRAQLQPVALDPLLAALVDEAAVLARAKGLRLRRVPTRTWVQADPQLLRRVLRNFLANAVRYTLRGGIVVGVRRRAGGIAIEVCDSGPGIPPGQQRLVFEEFRRLQRGGPGLGLGLAIAERLARLQGTRVHLRSQEGRGSCFGLLLPRVAAATAAVRPPPSAEPVESVEGRIPLRMLVVDNEAGVLDATRQLLEGWGVEVRVATGPEAALAAAEGFAPQAWLLDFHLDDGATGAALHRELAARHPGALGLVVSADHGEAVRSAVLAVGARPLTKPLKPLRLRSLLQHHATAG
ncbi:MAG: PAS-domain containing protein [Xanthomonadaceae bacterium]|nr:PAS-domain containing protein [Xanthomonadaceae bacterium]